MTDTKQLPGSVMIFGCGYIGTALARACMDAGLRVGALTRNAEKAAQLQALGVSEVVVADLDDPSWQGRLQGEYSAVVNCVSSAGGGLAGYQKSYVDGQRAILDWAQGRGIQTYLYTSSTSVYPQDGGVAVDEAADTAGAPPTGQLILESERLIAAAAAQFGRWYVFRLAGIYGPGRHYLLDQIRQSQGAIPGRGDHTLNLIHRDDVVGAILCALSHAAPSGVYNVADDGPAHKAELVAWLAQTLGQAVPEFDAAAVSPRLQRRGGRMPDRRILNGKLKAALDWAPQYPDFRAGYRALLAAGS